MDDSGHEQPRDLDASIENWMRRAIELSQTCFAEGGGPFGAVIVQGDRIIGEGRNRVTLDNDPTAHAEVLAIRQACRTLGDFQLTDCKLFASCEPCPMCFSAIHWARISHVYYANLGSDAAAAGI